MGSDSIVVLAPLVDEDLGLLEAVEDFAVEQLVPKLAVDTSRVIARSSRWGKRELILLAGNHHVACPHLPWQVGGVTWVRSNGASATIVSIKFLARTGYPLGPHYSGQPHGAQRLAQGDVMEAGFDLKFAWNVQSIKSPNELTQASAHPAVIF
jgi:hypothetical protein